MRHSPVRTAACAVVLLTVGAVAPVPSASAEASPPVHVVATDLSSPKGLATDGNKALIVAQGAFGAPGPVLVFPPGEDPYEVTGPLNLVDVAVSPLDGTGWGIGPMEVGGELHGMLFHQLADGTIEAVLDITAYQATDPDPVDNDQPPFPEDSNAYGLTVMDDGDALVADAAGNDVIRVSPEGDAFTVARFDLEPVRTAHLQDPGLPPKILAEAVPTTVTIGPDGAIYVGELKGFPFRPRSSHIWRIEADADGAWCSVRVDDDDCGVFQSGFTAIQDLAFNPRTGTYYVLELAQRGVLAFEEGFGTGVFPPAVLLEVKGTQRKELAAGQLSEPGGVAVTSDNKVYVTDGLFNADPAVNDGRLVRVIG